MKLYIAAEHCGVELKKSILESLKSNNFPITDLYPIQDMTDDYPDVSSIMASKLLLEPESFGVVICGSGQGIAMAMNRHKGIRCAMPRTVEEITKSREHNNTNCVSFASTIDPELAVQIIIAMINSPFSEEQKHHRRVQKLDLLG